MKDTNEDLLTEIALILTNVPQTLTTVTTWQTALIMTALLYVVASLVGRTVIPIAKVIARELIVLILMNALMKMTKHSPQKKYSRTTFHLENVPNSVR